MPTVTVNGGAQFESDVSSPILDAAARSNITLPYSCKTGRCGVCKCKVVNGLTRPLRPESGLSEKEKAQGWILSCVRVAETDLSLEVDDLEGIDLPAIKTVPCRIDQLERIAVDVLRVNLRLPPTTDFRFIPGQHIELIGVNGVRRSYSLAKANSSNKVIELHIRAVHGGELSQYWFSRAKINDLLRLNGPLGTFFLRDTVGLNIVFLATGTGIAPVKAMLEFLAEKQIDQRPMSITVLWGGRYFHDLYFNIEEIPGEFEFIPVLSRPEDKWRGARGYVQDVLLSLMPDLSNTVVYACGSNAMINSAKSTLFRAGLPENRFYADAFLSSGIN